MRRGILVVHASLFVFLSTLAAAGVQAQTLNWGANGVGGSGIWDTTTANWFDGISNVPWSSGGNAVFGGASGGNVTVSSTGQVVSSITFNTPVYALSGGTIESSSTGLTVTANANCTIGSLLEASAGTGSTLVKDGPATLTLSGTNFLDYVQVNEGQLVVRGSSSLFFSQLTLADTSGVTVTFQQSSAGASVGGLDGGGSLGGIVQPSSETGTLTLDLFSVGAGGHTFDGTIQNNGAGTLAIYLVGGQQTFTGQNTYGGATTLQSGTLALSGNGTITNSPVVIGPGSTFAIDNSAAAVGNRLSSTLPFSINAGTLQMTGNAATAVNETAGQLRLSGASTIEVTQQSDTATQLSFAALNRNGHATLDVSGPGVRIAGLANGATGIVAPYITAGNDWATIGADGRITAWTNYSSDINSGGPTDHVKIAASGTTTLASSTMRASLNMQNSNALATQTFDLAGHSLTLTSGGLLTSGAASSSIVGGQLSSAPTEMVVTTNNNLTIGAAIADGNGITTLNKTGPGTLTLTGTSSYTGPTVITQGTLIATSDASLGQGPAIIFNGGNFQAAGDFVSTKGLSAEGGAPPTFDTAGHNVTLAGAVTADLTKVGLGTLVLPGANSSSLTVNEGTLALPNGTTANANLFGGTLQAAGTVSGLEIGALSYSTSMLRLDIGGPAAATLTTQFLSFVNIPSSNANLLVDFGIGSSASDLWQFGSSTFWPTSPGFFQFEFQNLGGLAAGIAYPLFTFPRFSQLPSTSIFQIAPDLAAAGWAGTFNVSKDGVSVTFSAVPEPSTTALVALQGIVLACTAQRGLRAKQRKKRGNPAACQGDRGAN